MREIKFRAWDTKRKIMIGTDYKENWGNEKDEWYADEHLMMLQGIEDISKDDRFRLMQYTGLKDKNGKEIYEGDILCVLEDVVADTIDGYNRYEQEGDFMEVVFDEYGRWSIKGNSMVIGELLHDMLSDAEIIGNIYENPDFITNP